jgi:hypothetical protein
MYNLVYDEKELEKFFDTVLPELKSTEVYFLSLSARNKYLSEDERKVLSLGRTEMFERRVVREQSFERFLRTLRKFEVNDGAYLTKNGSNIPEKCIVVYMNINPTDVLKAHKEFSQTMNEYMFELATCSAEGKDTSDIMKRIKKQDTLLMNCYQRNRGTKHFIDIDFDIPHSYYENVVAPFLSRLKTRRVSYVVIQTSGGYHILLRRNTIQYNFNEDVYKANEDFIKEFMKRNNLTMKDVSGNNPDVNMKRDTGYEIVVNRNEMIPLPGTLQAGVKVRIL